MSMTSADPEAPTGWLPPLVLFEQYSGNWRAYEDALYAFFKADFIDSEPSYPGRRWAVKRHPEFQGREATFWHITSEGEVEAERTPDLRRCERIRWPRPMIDACRTDRLRCWPQTRRNRAGGRETRIVIATPDFSYLVILADRESYIMLWTTIHIVAYIAAAARVADALTQDVLLAPIESSVIPLPHQIRALSRAIANDRVRYLLADEVGLGKTIEAGLIMRELKLRGLVKRTLVIAPKGLVSQWVAEMQAHFNETFPACLTGRH
jgi:hypothetical protein